MRRDHNEDSYLVDDDSQLYVVADGMGGHLGGERASKLAVVTVQSSVIEDRREVVNGKVFRGPIEEHPALMLLPRAVKKACAAIFHEAQNEPELQGMGTTVTGVAFIGGLAFFGHVGDSRAYLIRDGRIDQLSDDHSLVNEQLKAGLITPEQAKMSRFRHIITRSVGFEEDVAVDTMVVPIQEGDIYVLCSDGLANLVTQTEIRDVIYDNFMRDAPNQLIALANERGGDDNITVVMVYVNGED
ncbi:MAG: Stp1/IreP family PP2C-type Ser/Thr phosphatase [Myxococcales bacterium]|nr:Stp1/IreP family PP2C-type Ser/Thr phosphatase [Myxococcales bacterium]